MPQPKLVAIDTHASWFATAITCPTKSAGSRTIDVRSLIKKLSLNITKPKTHFFPLRSVLNVYYIKNVLKPHGCKTGCPQIVHSNVCAIECTKYNSILVNAHLRNTLWTIFFFFRTNWISQYRMSDRKSGAFYLHVKRNVSCAHLWLLLLLLLVLFDWTKRRPRENTAHDADTA